MISKTGSPKILCSLQLLDIVDYFLGINNILLYYENK